MLDIGAEIEGWRVHRVIHEGSMAVTYEVTRPPEPTRYALKLLYLREPSFRERLRRVGLAQRALQHPNLVPVVDVVEVDDAPGVVSVYIEGVDLAQWSAERRELAEHVRLFRQIIEGLSAAHDRGLVHRNLKPAKILIDARGVPLLHDFMLGKVVAADVDGLTQMGTTFGTPQYMAPEQFRGASEVDARADLFSAGCLLFEMLTRKRPFDGQGLMEIYRQVTDPLRPDLSAHRADAPPALVRLVDDLLAVDRDARPADARAVAQRLDTDPALRALQGLSPLAVEGGRTGATLSPPDDEPAPHEPLLADDALGAPAVSAPPASTPAPPAAPEPAPAATPAHRDPLHDPMATPLWEVVFAVLVVALGVAAVVTGVVVGGL